MAKRKKGYKAPGVIVTGIQFTKDDFKDMDVREVTTKGEYTIHYSKDYTIDYNKSEVV